MLPYDKIEDDSMKAISKNELIQKLKEIKKEEPIQEYLRLLKEENIRIPYFLEE